MRNHSIIATLCLLLAAACGRSPEGERAGASTAALDNDGRKILRVAYEREIDVLNALTSQNLVDIQFSMIEGLVTTDENNNYIPVLAREIPSEENGLIERTTDGTIDITWRLHDNVRWHDGEPFTSEDVCFTWKFVVDEGSQTYNRDQYLGIVDCRTPDEHTVVFTWDGEYGYYAGLFEAILPAHVLGGMSTEEIVNYTPYNRGAATVGTGPFKFAEWKAGEYVRVLRNDDYWRGPEYPAIDEVVWTFIPDSNTRLNAMKAGQYDYARLEPLHAQEVAGLEGYELHLISSNTFMHFDLNIQGDLGRRLFADRDVRRAMFHAIDRRAIAEQLMRGMVKIAHTPLNPTSPYHAADVMNYEFDPGLSRRMLDEAGWLEGPDGIRMRAGDRFSFVLMNRAGMADRIAVAQVVQAQLKAVGIEATFETLENAAWTQRWRSGDWQGLVSAWFLPADPSLTNLYACGGSNNMTGFCDPDLDVVLRRSDRVLGFAERKPLLDEAQARLAETAHSLPIYHNVVPELVSRRVSGYRGSGTNFGSFWNLYAWDLGE